MTEPENQVCEEENISVLIFLKYNVFLFKEEITSLK